MHQKVCWKYAMYAMSNALQYPDLNRIFTDWLAHLTVTPVQDEDSSGETEIFNSQELALRHLAQTEPTGMDESTMRGFRNIGADPDLSSCSRHLNIQRIPVQMSVSKK